MRFFPIPKEIFNYAATLIYKDSLERMRGTAIGIAAFTAALIFFIAEKKGGTCWSQVSLFASIVAMAAWVTMYFYIDAFVVHGEKTYSEMNFLICGASAAIGYVSLAAAMIAIVMDVSVLFGLVMAVITIAVAFFACRHEAKLRKIASE